MCSRSRALNNGGILSRKGEAKGLNLMAEYAGCNGTSLNIMEGASFRIKSHWDEELGS